MPKLACNTTKACTLQVTKKAAAKTGTAAKAPATKSGGTKKVVKKAAPKKPAAKKESPKQVSCCLVKDQDAFAAPQASAGMDAILLQGHLRWVMSPSPSTSQPVQQAQQEAVEQANPKKPAAKKESPKQERCLELLSVDQDRSAGTHAICTCT